MSDPVIITAAAQAHCEAGLIVIRRHRREIKPFPPTPGPPPPPAANQVRRIRERPLRAHR